MVSETDAVIRVALAAALGAAIGLERELSEKPAGLRTYMLVAEGAALFMVASLLLGQEFNTGQSAKIDITRMPAAVITGIGFLGAGMILQERRRIYGLTTAAAIWVAAAIGILVGAGHYWTAIFTTAMTVVTLLVPRWFESWLGTAKTSAYEPGGDDEHPIKE